MKQLRAAFKRHKDKTLLPFTELAEIIGVSHPVLIRFYHGGDIRQRRVVESIENYLNSLKPKRKNQK